MTNQTAHPPSGKPEQSGPDQARPAQPGSTQSRTGQSAGGAQRAATGIPPRKRRSSSLMLALVMLIAAVFAIVLLSPDQMREIVAPFIGRTPPSATIAVAPAPGSQPAPSSPAPSSSAPAAPRPSTSAAIPPTTPPPSATPNAAAVNSELQTLRTMLADVTGRLGDLERTAAEPRTADLENRLNALDARIAALIEQPVVTPNALADALTENRQVSQAAAQEAAQSAAQEATQKATQDAVQRAVQDAVQKATAAQKDMAPAFAELEKRLTALEKMAPAVVAIADIEKRVSGLEKMAPAVAAIADLERRLAGLEKTAASATTLADLERRLAGVEKTAGPLAAMSQSALQGEALALGLLNLRLALDRGAPYADVLSALRVAAANDAVLTGEIDRLAPAAASGAPTITILRQRLLAMPVIEAPKPAAAAPSDTSEAPAESVGFWADIWRRFASIITVRRLDANAQTTGQPSSGAAAMGTAIERAAARLAADDLAGAIAVLDDEATRRNLTPTQQITLDDWLREARARLTAETGFATLSRRSLALFAAKVDMSPAPVPARPAPADPAPSAPPAAAPSTVAPPSTAPQGSDAATPGDLPPGP